MSDEGLPSSTSRELSEQDGGRGNWFARYFEFGKYDTDLWTEIVAGATTFIAMSYMVVVIPALLAAGPESPGIAISGMEPAAVQQMLAVATILTSSIAIFVMAFYANRPFALGPGLGLASFFAFTVIGQLGVPWQTALAAVFVEGILFIVLTVTGARSIVSHLLPKPVKLSIGSGIGVFLAIIGLQEMQVVVADPATMITMGKIATNPVALLSVIGLFITLMLYTRGLTGSLILGIIATTVIAYLAPTLGLGNAESLALGGLEGAQYNILPLVGAFIEGFKDIDGVVFSMIVFTFFFVDFFDSTGAVTGAGQLGGLLDENGDLPEIDKPLMADAIGTTASGILGTSTVTTYIDSGAGIEEGGRTGMTALVVGVLFLATLLAVPFITLIPAYASHIALVVVALFMLKNVTEIEWSNLTHAIPAGLTIMIMPLTYSIAYGIAAGIISYPLMKTANGEFRDVHVGQWLLAGAFIVYFYVTTSGVLKAMV